MGKKKKKAKASGQANHKSAKKAGFTLDNLSTDSDMGSEEREFIAREIEMMRSLPGRENWLGLRGFKVDSEFGSEDEDGELDMNEDFPLLAAAGVYKPTSSSTRSTGASSGAKNSSSTPRPEAPLIRKGFLKDVGGKQKIVDVPTIAPSSPTKIPCSSSPEQGSRRPPPGASSELLSPVAVNGEDRDAGGSETCVSDDLQQLPTATLPVKTTNCSQKPFLALNGTVELTSTSTVPIPGNLSAPRPDSSDMPVYTGFPPLCRDTLDEISEISQNPVPVLSEIASPTLPAVSLSHVDHFTVEDRVLPHDICKMEKKGSEEGGDGLLGHAWAKSGPAGRANGPFSTSMGQMQLHGPNPSLGRPDSLESAGNKDWPDLAQENRRKDGCGPSDPCTGHAARPEAGPGMGQGTDRTNTVGQNAFRAGHFPSKVTDSSKDDVGTCQQILAREKIEKTKNGPSGPTTAHSVQPAKGQIYQCMGQKNSERCIWTGKGMDGIKEAGGPLGPNLAHNIFDQARNGPSDPCLGHVPGPCMGQLGQTTARTLPMGQISNGVGQLTSTQLDDSRGVRGVSKPNLAHENLHKEQIGPWESCMDHAARPSMGQRMGPIHPTGQNENGVGLYAQTLPTERGLHGGPNEAKTFAQVMRNKVEPKANRDLKFVHVEERGVEGPFLIPSMVQEAGSMVWANTLVGFIIGRRLPYELVNRVAKRMWDRLGLTRVVSHGPGAFLFKFNSDEVFGDILEKCPLSIARCPLLLQKWTPQSSLSMKEPTTLPIWIRIHDIPSVLFQQLNPKP